jgi:hypothetical protein
MGSRKLWLKESTTYCFNEFTTESLDEGQDRWYLPRKENGKLAMPNAQRGMGGDIVKLWFEEAHADNPKLWGTPMNLQNF